MSNKSKGGAKWKLRINKSQMAENFHKKKEMEGEREREREREGGRRDLIGYSSLYVSSVMFLRHCFILWHCSSSSLSSLSISSLCCLSSSNFTTTSPLLPLWLAPLHGDEICALWHHQSTQLPTNIISVKINTWTHTVLDCIVFLEIFC